MTKFAREDDKGYQDVLRELRVMVENPAFRQFWLGLGEPNIVPHLRQTAEPLPGTLGWIESYIKLNKQSDGSTPHRLVRITGKPGCGKSVLGASLYRNLLDKYEQERVPNGSQPQTQSEESQQDHQQDNQQDNKQKKGTPRVTPLFYAFSGRDATRRSPDGYLASMIRQLFSSKEDRTVLRQHFDRNYLGKRDHEFPSIYFDIFRWALGLPVFGQIVCIIDALDECDQGPKKADLISNFGDILLREDYNVSLILLNRDYWDLNFEGVKLPAETSLHIELDRMDETRHDLRLFTNSWVEQLVQRRPAYEDFQERLAEKVYNRASEGMFLMVYLVAELLLKSTDSSPVGIDRTINSLPSTLQEVYQRIWDSIENKERARQIMGWIVALREPVAWQTLADAIAHEQLMEHDQDNAESSFKIQDFRTIDLLGDIKRLFGPLVTTYDKVGLAHETVKEFFMKEANFANRDDAPNGLLPSNGQIRIATVCAFCMRENAGGRVYNSADSIVGVRIPPFYTYAIRNHEGHYEAALQRGEDIRMIREYEHMMKKTASFGPGDKRKLEKRRLLGRTSRLRSSSSMSRSPDLSSSSSTDHRRRFGVRAGRGVKRFVRRPRRSEG